MIEFIVGAILLLISASLCTSIILRNIIICFAILLLLIGCCVKTQIENYNCSGISCVSDDKVENIPVDDSNNPAIFSGKFKYSEFVRFCDSDTYDDTVSLLFSIITKPVVYLLQESITLVEFNPLKDFKDVKMVFNKKNDIDISCNNLDLDKDYLCESGIYGKDDGTVCIDLCLMFNIIVKNLTLDLLIEDTDLSIFNVNLEGQTKCRIGLEISDNSIIVAYMELTDANYNNVNVFSQDNGQITLIKGAFQYMNGIVSFFNKTISDILVKESILPYTIPDISDQIVNKIKSILTAGLNPVPSTYKGLTIPTEPVNVTIGYIEFQSIFITNVFYYLQFIIKYSKDITFFPNICNDASTSSDGCGITINPSYDFSTCCKGSTLYNIDFSCQPNGLIFNISDIDLSATINHLCSINLFDLIPALFNQCKLEQVALKPCTEQSTTFCTYPAERECGDLNSYPWGCLFCPYSDNSEFTVSICDINISNLIDVAKFQLLSVTPTFIDNDYSKVDQNRLNYIFSLNSGEGTIDINLSMKGKTIVELLKYISPDTPNDPTIWYNDVLQIQFENLRLIVNGVNYVESNEQYIIQTDNFELTYDNFTIVNIANLDFKPGFCDAFANEVIKKLYCGFFGFFGDLLTEALTQYAPQLISILTLLMIILPIITFVLTPLTLPLVMITEAILMTFIFLLFITIMIAVIVNKSPWNVDAFYQLGTTLIGTIFPWGKIATTVFETLNTKLKENANAILKEFLLPIIPKHSFLTLFENGTDYNCSCKNICARNWDNVLSGADGGGWKNASCGQTVQLDVSGTSVTNVNYYDCDVNPQPSTDTQKNGCLCVNDLCIDDTAPSCFQPNKNVSCNAPLGYYILKNSQNISCDVFCQQGLGNLPSPTDTSQSETVRPPNTLSSYCLNAKKDDGTQIPCYTPPESGENLTCFCSRNNDLYVPYTSTDYNIYGDVKLPVLASSVGVYLVNLTDNMYLVCYQTDKDNYIVKGIPIQTGIPVTKLNFDIIQSLNQTPLSRNIYGEKSIWIFEQLYPDSDSSNTSTPPPVNSILYYIKSKFNDLYLYDPNDPLSFTAATDPNFASEATFEDLGVTAKDSSSSPNNMKFVWKIIQNSVKNVSIVNVFSNRCIVGIPKSKLEEVFNIMSNNNSSDQELATAYDCYNKYSNLNVWGIMNAAIFPPSEFDRNQTQQVYNICNVANWSTISIFNGVQFLPSSTNTLTLNGVEYEYPKGPMILPSFYPPTNSTSESQWLVKQESDFYTIQNVSFGNTVYYLYEMAIDDNCPKYGPEGNQICMNVSIKSIGDTTNIPDDAKWKIPMIKKKKNIFYNVIQAASGKYLTQSEYSPLGDKDLATQAVNNLNKKVSLFYTSEVSGDPESDDFIINKHTVAWSFFPTNPQTIPTNFYRENIMCPQTTSDPTSPTVQPSSNLCSTFMNSELYHPIENPPDLSRENLNILSNQTDNGACMVDFPNMLKIYTPPNYDETETWDQKVDSLQSANLIPDFVPLRSPCNSYGNLSNYSLIGNASTGFNIQKSNDSKCMVYDPDAPNVKLKYKECGPPEWQIYPYEQSSSAAPFHNVTAFLENGKQYYLLNTILLQLLYLKNDTLQLTSSAIGLASFPSESSDKGFSQIMFEKDDSDNTNHISFVNVDGNKYIGCGLSSVIDQINKGDLNQGDFIDISLFSEKSTDTAFNFMLIKNSNLNDDGSNCYSYLIRSENTLPDKDGQYWAVYMAYKTECFDDECEDVSFAPAFYVAQCDNEPFNYLYNDIFLNSLLHSANGQKLYWSFNNVSSISNSGNNSLLYSIKNTKDNNMCIEKATQEFSGTNMFYYDVKPCNSENINQRFSFQGANYMPADYPYINFNNVPNPKT